MPIEPKSEWSYFQGYFCPTKLVSRVTLSVDLRLSGLVLFDDLYLSAFDTTGN